MGSIREDIKKLETLTDESIWEWIGRVRPDLLPEYQEMAAICEDEGWRRLEDIMYRMMLMSISEAGAGRQEIIELRRAEHAPEVNPLAYLNQGPQPDREDGKKYRGVAEERRRGGRR